MSIEPISREGDGMGADEVRRLADARDAVEGAKARIGRSSLTAGILDAGGVGDWGDTPPHSRGIAFACRLCRSPESLSAFRDLILHLEAHAGKVVHYRPHHGQPSCLLALQNLAENRRLWRRDPAAWRPKSGPAPRQFEHLLRFLLDADEAARFQDSMRNGSPSAWARLWFGHLGRDYHGGGGGMRPVVLTKRMAYHFLLAPEPFDGIRALRWSQTIGYGGPSWLAGALDLTRLSWQLWDPAGEEWWAGVIEWLAKQRCRKRDVTPLIDYIYSRRYGVAALGLLPHPDFSLKGRAVRVLMETVKEWHEYVALIKSTTEIEFPKSGIERGRYERIDGDDVAVWTVEQIRHTAALFEEGRAMRHCVATYLPQVEKGSFSIWTMKHRRGDIVKRAVTIQVKDRRIIQCRGRCNRMPKGEERRILGQWAGENNLKIEKV